jgi:hypothetical protein
MWVKPTGTGLGLFDGRLETATSAGWFGYLILYFPIPPIIFNHADFDDRTN